MLRGSGYRPPRRHDSPVADVFVLMFWFTVIAILVMEAW